MPRASLPEKIEDRQALYGDGVCTSLLFDLELAADETGKTRAPERIPLLPNKKHVKARDGREFLIEDPQALIDAARAGGIDLVVGRNHDEVGSVFGKGYAPAAGWISHRDGLVRNGEYGIDGIVQWTEIGTQTVASREGRYISPVLDIPDMYDFLFEDGPVPTVMGIVAASVVNIPALRMPSLNSREITAPRGRKSKMDEDTRQRLCAAFGLPADAKDETIFAMAEARDLPPTPAPDLKNWVPREEFSALAGRLKQLEAAAATGQVDQAIARHKAKIQSPAYEKALREQLQSGALSFAAFESLMEATPESRLTKADEEPARDDVDLAALGLEPYELEFCKSNDVDPKKFAQNLSRRRNRRHIRAL